MEWNKFYIPPVRMVKTGATHAQPLLVTDSRRVKLNDHPEDQEPIDPAAFKIMLTGNSTCAGGGASKNSEMFAAHLQNSLKKKYGQKIQVINFCVPDSKFADELISYVLHLNFIKPNIWISFNGDNDSSVTRNSFPTSIKYLEGRKLINTAFLNRGIVVLPYTQKALTSFFTYDAVKKINDDLESSSEPMTRQSDESIYLANLRNAMALAKGADIRFIHFLQPVLGIGKRVPRPSELKESGRLAIEWGETGSPKMRNSLAEFYASLDKELRLLAKDKKLSPSYIFHDMEGVFDQAGDRDVYFDFRHYNDLGQRLIADRLLRILDPMIAKDLSAFKAAN